MGGNFSILPLTEVEMAVFVISRLVMSKPNPSRKWCVICESTIS